MKYNKETATPVKPNFFIIGEQKSGTSFLHACLKLHPQIFMAKEKEPGFFATDLIHDSYTLHKRHLFYKYLSKKDYLRLFDSATSELVLGESSSTYLYSREAANNIHTFNPNAKLLIILREPSSFLFSLHSQYIKETTEDEPCFEVALSLESKRKSGLNIPKWTRSPSLLYYRERTEYLSNIQRFTKIFPKNQILIIIYDDLLNNKQETLLKVLEFLAVSPVLSSDLGIINKSKKIRIDFLSRLANNPYLKNSIAKLLTPSQQNFLKRYVELILLSSKNDRYLDELTRISLMKEFKPKVSDLSYYLVTEGYINSDLIKMWGYDAINDSQNPPNSGL